MNYTIDPSYTIQKIARDIMRQTGNGNDPLTLLLKEAKTNNLTPPVITSAVHYLNNEIYLDHYNRQSEGTPKTINPDDVLRELGITNEKTASIPQGSLDDFTATREFSPYVDPQIAKRQKEQILRHIKSAESEESVLRRDLDSKANSLGIQIAGGKRKLEETVKIALYRKEIQPEEVYILAKSAVDKDVAEILESSLAKYKVSETELTKMSSDFDVNTKSPVYEDIHYIMNKKAEYSELYSNMSSLEIADLRRKGIKRLLNAHMGYYY